jgi:hypothetical protein
LPFGKKVKKVLETAKGLGLLNRISSEYKKYGRYFIMRKWFKEASVILATALTLMVIAPTAAFAHGHGKNFAPQSYALCGVGNCDITGTHQHDGAYCAGHSLNDEHDYHTLCTALNCAKTANHTHNGASYLPHTVGDGHGYHTSPKHSGGHH